MSGWQKSQQERGRVVYQLRACSLTTQGLCLNRRVALEEICAHLQTYSRVKEAGMIVAQLFHVITFGRLFRVPVRVWNTDMRLYHG